MRIKPLSKKVLVSLTMNEKKTLDTLIQSHQTLQNKMVLLQRAYTDAARSGNIKDAELREMADKGFQAEYETIQAMSKLQRFINIIHKKYAT